jgi:DNA-binding PadR family transcriptional regulator
MGLPELTHLQIAVLGTLMNGELTGRSLREQLAGLGQKHTRAAFYQLMGRLEDSGFVKGRYDHQMIEGVAIKERVYEVTGSGSAAYDAALAYYQHRAANRLGWQGV